MTNFQDLQFGPRSYGLAGVQALTFFDNGYGASVIKGSCTYGGDEGLYELAVMKVTDLENKVCELCYTTPVTDDVLSYLSEDAVTEALQAIAALPAHKQVD